MAHVGKYRVRRGWFGKAILQSLVKYPSMIGPHPDASNPRWEWVDAEFDHAPDSLVAPNYPYPNTTGSNVQDGA
jgi:hypothetical protein